MKGTRAAGGLTSTKNRLADALSKLTSASRAGASRPTVAALCRLARVSRNTVYRDYADVAESVRRLRRRRGRRYDVRVQRVTALRTEVAALRAQLAKLAALADHYHAAAEELRSRLAHRDRELAALRERLRPVAMHRASPNGAHKSPSWTKLRT